RPLRNLAEDPFFGGKITEIMDGGAPRPTDPSLQWRTKNENWGPEGSEILAVVPPGKPLAPGDTAAESITRTLAKSMSGSQLIEVIAQMKAFAITHPKRAHQLLSHHPQLAYAIFMGLIMSKIIPADILHRMVEAASQNNHPMMPLAPPPPSP
ncbi:hinge domain of cleavage stimulation factor subunit 2-domain-containing protein, partial [Mycena crocata]